MPIGGQSLVTVTLPGKIDYPVAVYPGAGRGQELPTAYRILQEFPQQLRPYAPQLWLCDGLYINQHTFRLVRSSAAHLLVKCGDNPLFRDILRDAQALFTHPSTACEPVESASGFDPERLCSWTIQKTSGEFAGYPLTIFFLTEDYPKRKNAPQEETWIVTTDRSRSPQEAREAAHLRWHIENNVFKRLSHLCGTKRFYFKDPPAILYLTPTVLSGGHNLRRFLFKYTSRGRTLQPIEGWNQAYLEEPVFSTGGSAASVLWKAPGVWLLSEDFFGYVRAFLT